MATNFCYCIGGTGARVAEVAAHLCAANMVRAGDSIEFIVVDKDFDCKGTENAEKTIGKIAGLSKPGGIMTRSTAKFGGAQPLPELCKMDLRKFNWSFTKAMDMLSTHAGAGTYSIQDTLCVSDDDKCLLDALYSKGEQSQNTDKGFYGHPSIGALIFNYMVKRANWNPAAGAGDIAAPVLDYLATPNNEAKVFIIGSIFGGTGASVFSNLAKYIRKSAVRAGYGNRLFMSGCLLLPYFNFPAPANGADLKVDSNDFYIKSKVALEQYGLDTALVRTGTAPNGFTFDTLYVLGQNPLHVTSAYHCDGGQGQCNHFDLVDLLAADAMTEFFNAPNGSLNPDTSRSNIFEYRLSNVATPGDVLNVPVDFTMLPNLARPIKAMLVFSGFVISEVYADLLFRPEVSEVNVLKAMEKPGFMAGKNAKNTMFANIRNEVAPVVKEVYNYCSTYVRLANDLSKIGCSWDGVTPSMQWAYALIDSGYMDYLGLVCDMIEKASAGTLTPQDANMVVQATNTLHTLPPFAGATFNLNNVVDYLRDLCNQGGVWRGVAGADYGRRTADYIHEAYKFISANV